MDSIAGFFTWLSSSRSAVSSAGCIDTYSLLVVALFLLKLKFFSEETLDPIRCNVGTSFR